MIGKNGIIFWMVNNSNKEAQLVTLFALLVILLFLFLEDNKTNDSDK